ncbi:hypothetical protein BC830DRAFT_1214876 [Chytriomyces sp. MP71]|nr:hypothetical protein BC830DRAFT_1214876 [Chytriomyces sp. MP71]
MKSLALTTFSPPRPRATRLLFITVTVTIIVSMSFMCLLPSLRYRYHLANEPGGNSQDSRHKLNQLTCANVSARYPGKPPIKAAASSVSFDVTSFVGSVPRISPQTTSKSRLRAISINTMGTELPGLMCLSTLFSAALNNVPLEIYGSNAYFERISEGISNKKSAKMDILQSILCQLDPLDPILMVDAFDVIFQRPWDEIEYLYAKRWNSPEFVMSTESNCYPRFIPKVCVGNDFPPVPPNGVPFINSGVIVGKAGAMLEIIGHALEVRKEGIFGNKTKVMGDQAAYARAYYDHYRRKGFMMDHLSELSSSPNPPKPAFVELDGGNGRYFWWDPHTRNVPMIVHLNGNGKNMYWNKQYYLRNGKLKRELREQVSNYTFIFEGETATVEGICKDWMELN